MVLEAIEDDLRGWRAGKAGLGDERVTRGKYAIEHVMPRKWGSHWPLIDGENEAERDRLIHTLGNLTLLTGRLNTKVSNGPWLGEKSKRRGLEKHDVLLLNREVLKAAGNEWSDAAIRARTEELVESIILIWPVPPEHRSGISADRKPRLGKTVTLHDLINGGALTPGMMLFPRRKRFSEHVATLLPEGQVEVDGVAYANPSDAASTIIGKRTGGWWFFLTDQTTHRSLRDVRRDYVTAMAVDVEDDDADDEREDDE